MANKEKTLEEIVKELEIKIKEISLEIEHKKDLYNKLSLLKIDLEEVIKNGR